ncbi:hypothetical protein EUTSA_v10015443mg [Eutrema salsugineum]|uniref:J domain-containing protein n=1 Tax=Eutrema salsugineum TaxID=72664 RepID=V4LEP3_EUTSA|nr:uncharacterized protein LOC18016664 [Eutrema salsugineum]ESQ40887.1 hypothetical protein EUTSA_v10015443mg [Eutrema salsugineum]
MEGGDGNRAEADRWLVASEKHLASSDFHGAKTFAIRACKADPSRTHASDFILAISDTLLAGESTVGDSKLPDWYAVLRLIRLTQNHEHIAIQYRRLALLLNPTVNRLPFAVQALKIVSDAWSVLSDPPRKSIYDRELKLIQIGQFGQTQSQSQQFQDSPLQSQAETFMATNFWTSCPYCFALFEYPKGYEECALRCQHCRRAFSAVKTQTLPPVESNGERVYFCSWAVFPLAFSGHAISSGSGRSTISPLYVCPEQSFDQQANITAPPRNYYDDNNDDLYVIISDDD